MMSFPLEAATSRAGLGPDRQAVWSWLERVQARLAGHWMFSGPAGEARARVLTMCEDCRVETVVNEGFDPHDATTRKVRTRDDYRDA